MRVEGEKLGMAGERVMAIFWVPPRVDWRRWGEESVSKRANFSLATWGERAK